MTPNVISVLLISTTTDKILAETFIEYCEVEKGGIWQTIQRITSDPNLQRILLTQLLLYMQSNLGGKPGTCGSGKRGDGSSDGGPSGGGASGGGAYGGGSSGEGPRGSGASGDGTGGTGVSGCGSNGCGAFGSGATRCQYSRGASQPGSDAVWELCELIQKCSVCIWRQNPSTTHNKACTEDEEDLEDDQLLMIHQPSDENYFADTEDYSSVSSESDSALSDSENWDESLSDSSLSFPWVNSRSRKSQKASAKTESTEHFYKAVNSELNVSHEILTALTEGLNSEISIGEDESHCLEWNTHLSGSKKTEENDEKDDHNEKLDSSQEWSLCYEASTSHTLLASQDNTPMLCIDVPALNVENEESQYQDDELFEKLHTKNAKPQHLESILSVTSNQQSTTHTGPVTQKAARSPLSNPLWNGIGDSKLNKASPQCSDEEIHSGHEWKESGLASWFDLCENEDAEKNEPSRWEMSSMEPNKTDGGVEKDVFDSEQDLSQEQGFFSEKGNLDIHLSSPDDTSVQSLGPEVENKESQLYVDIQLAHAARNGDTRVARLLIKNGADVNKEGENTPLTAAAKNGHRDIVRLLIENGADVNKEGGGIWKNTPLTAAAENGHTDIVRLLIENGANVNKRGLNAPLTPAARNGHKDIVRLLIENGADVNKEGGGNTPLTAAAENGHTGIVRLLIENGADVNKEGGWIYGITPLTAAAKNGHRNIVRLLIENGADVNKGGRETPLTAAAQNGHRDIVRLLKAYGANVNGREWYFKIITLPAAAENGHTDIVRLLIENGADVNNVDWIVDNTALGAAAKNGHTDIVRLLIENGADVNEGGGIYENIPLIAAAENGHTDIVRLLIENGGDVNKGGMNTPLTAAAENGHTDIIRLLIENGANVNKERGWILNHTALGEAAENGHTDIVRLLIENGADVNESCDLNYTALLAAAKNGHTDIMRLLIKNGADVNEGGGWNTPLTAAAENGHTDIVRLLIENRADVNKEVGWNTPLTVAAKNGHTDIFRLLIENGADVSEGLWFEIELLVIEDEPLVDRRKFEADAMDTKLSLERHIDVQLRGKKVASLPKRPGKKLKTQTEMTSPRDIIEESKCGKDSMTDVELGLNCLHLSPRCEQFKPCIMEELPGDSSIMRHDFKPISKRMDRVTLRDVDNAKQGHCVVVEVAKTHPSGSIIYGRKINEEGSGVLGEPFQLATKDHKDTWEDEEVKAENVQIGSVFKYVQVGDEFVFQGNTKRPRQNVDKILLDLSCAGGSCRDIRDAYSYAEISSERIHQDCASKETLCFISIKCSEIQNESISFVAKLGELLNLKLNCREHFMLHLSPGALQLIDGEEPHLITGDGGSSKPWDQAICEGLVPKNEPREISFDKKPDDEAEETDDDIKN